MKEIAIENFYLEVLQNNKVALKSYSKNGIIKTPAFDCYLINKDRFKPFKTIQTVVYVYRPEEYNPDVFDGFLEWEPSLEIQFESFKRSMNDVEIIEARQFGKPVGLLVYHPGMRWILCLAVDPEHRRKGIATTLLEYLFNDLPQDVDEIKVLHIDDRDTGMKEFLTSSGFKLKTCHFEMLNKMN